MLVSQGSSDFRTPAALAVCQHPNGDGLYVPAEHAADGACFQPCDCKLRTYIAVDALRDMLELAYHPQGGENPAHPMDVIDQWMARAAVNAITGDTDA